MSRRTHAPSQTPKPAERARQSSGVVHKRASVTFEHDAFASDAFDDDEPTNPHILDPREYAKLSAGDGEYQWHDEDTDIRRAAEDCGQRRKTPGESEPARLTQEKQHFPLPYLPVDVSVPRPSVAAATHGTQIRALHRDIDTQPKIQLPILAQKPATDTQPPDARLWIAGAVGFILGVVVTLTTAMLLQTLG